LRDNRVNLTVYTSFDREMMSRQWTEVLGLVDKRLGLIDQEEQRQDDIDDLQDSFGKQAGQLMDWARKVKEALANLSSKPVSSTEDMVAQKREVEGMKKDAGEPMRLLEEMEKTGAALESMGVYDMTRTDASTTSLVQAFSQVMQLIERMIGQLEKQIKQSQDAGVTPQQMREYQDVFRHFDRDRSGTLQYVEFKACLRSLGHDYPVDKDGNENAEFLRVVSFVDPERKGYVTSKAFVDFMIQRETENVAKVDDVLDAFKSAAADKSFVTRQELEGMLPGEVTEYCVKMMDPFVNEDGYAVPNRFSFESFTRALFGEQMTQRMQEVERQRLETFSRVEATIRDSLDGMRKKVAAEDEMLRRKVAQTLEQSVEAARKLEAAAGERLAGVLQALCSEQVHYREQRRERAVRELDLVGRTRKAEEDQRGLSQREYMIGVLRKIEEETSRALGERERSEKASEAEASRRQRERLAKSKQELEERTAGMRKLATECHGQLVKFERMAEDAKRVADAARRTHERTEQERERRLAGARQAVREGLARLAAELERRKAEIVRKAAGEEQERENRWKTEGREEEKRSKDKEAAQQRLESEEARAREESERVRLERAEKVREERERAAREARESAAQAEQEKLATEARERAKADQTLRLAHEVVLREQSALAEASRTSSVQTSLGEQETRKRRWTDESQGLTVELTML
jgi:Ca2+-binding EF-hand superfamily protein